MFSLAHQNVMQRTHPQELLQQLGFSSEFTHQTYTFSNMQLPWVSFIVHFSFSIVIAIIYCILVKKIRLLSNGTRSCFLVLLFGYYSTGSGARKRLVTGDTRPSR